MSYTNSTTHYSIPLPTETDLVNGLDWNTSSEAIDSAIYEASEAAGTASRDITAIKATIANLQDADIFFQQELSETNGRVATLEQNAGKDEEDIQDLADMITDKAVTQAQSDAHVSVGEWFRYNGVLYVCTVEINIGDTIIPNTNCRATNIEDEMPQGGIDADDVGYDNQTSQLTATDVQAAIDELKGLIDALPTGGGNMKCALSAKVTITAATTHVNLTSLNLTSREDYMIILNGQLTGNNEFKGQLLTDNESATGFDIISPSSYINGMVSYQVITFNN